MTCRQHREAAARQIATEQMGDDRHWEAYLPTLSCAVRAIGMAAADLRREITATHWEFAFICALILLPLGAWLFDYLRAIIALR